MIMPLQHEEGKTMSIDRLSFKLLVFASTLAVLAIGGPVFGQTPQPWSWGEPASLNSGWTRMDILVAGRVREVRTPEEVKVYRRDAGIGTVRLRDRSPDGHPGGRYPPGRCDLGRGDPTRRGSGSATVGRA